MCAGFTSLALMSCGDNDYFDKQAYEHLVEEAFPVKNIDPAQDWKLTRTVVADVEVAYQGSYTLKFYSADPTVERSSASVLNAMDVVGGQAVSVRMVVPAGVSRLYVALVDEAGYRMHRDAAIADGRCSCSFGNVTGTRTVDAGSSQGFTVSSAGVKEYSREEMMFFATLLPENMDNRGKVVQDFSFTFPGEQGGTFVVYPRYTQTSQWNKECGIYYKDAAGDIQRIRLWSFSGNAFQLWDPAQWVNGVQSGNWVDVNTPFFDANWVLKPDYSRYRSEGVRVTVPAGVTRFGFYATTNDYRAPYVYSEKDDNPEEYHDGEMQRLSYGATFSDGSGNRYVCFEDWFENLENKDFNDLVLVIDGVEASVPEPITPPSQGETEQVQEYTYCFEDNFPEAGDYDFNDVVMGLKMNKKPRGTSARDTLTIQVELRAVGASKPIAAALRLKNVKSAMVGSQFKQTSEGNRKAFNFFDIERYNQLLAKSPKGDKYFLSSLDEADIVIPLYNDAHYAINGGIKENGDTKRRFYNTVADRSNEKGEVIEDEWIPENTYTLLFKDADAFNAVSIEDMDLFIIEEYNGTRFEVHTFDYKLSEVIHRWRGNPDAYTDNFPWGIVVPGHFRYPIEWTPIGTTPIANVKGGAYQTSGHSFGEWAQDRTKATDWFNYPFEELVY